MDAGFFLLLLPPVLQPPPHSLPAGGGGRSGGDCGWCAKCGADVEMMVMVAVGVGVVDDAAAVVVTTELRRGRTPTVGHRVGFKFGEFVAIPDFIIAEFCFIHHK